MFQKMNCSPVFSTFCSFFYLSILLRISVGTDILAPNQSINGSETLVSPRERFEFGFFSPGRSKTKYLGIWYKATPDVVVWVANRNNPLTDSQGVVTLQSSGTLVLLDSTNRVIWSSNVSRVAASPLVQLLDSGNLVLIDKTGTETLWQSFDYPTDTRLPGMLMGENSENGRELYYTSWKNADDPSPGEFVYKIEHGRDLSQLVLTSGTGIRFRTGPWNGLRFNGLLLFGDQAYESTYDYHRNKVISISDPYNVSAITRVILTESGLIQRYVLDEKKNEWDLTITIPEYTCDFYGHCGVNSVCNSDSSPNCRCLKGFTPKSQQEWGAHNWSSGCSRNVESDCQKDDTFVKVVGVKLPDPLQFRLISNMSLSECEKECLRNCSCTAYTNPFINSCNTSCLMWYGDLIDTREYGEEANEQYVYIRVPLSETKDISSSSGKKKSRALLISLSTASSTLFISAIICGWIIWKIKAKRRKELKTKKGDFELPLFDFATVAAATNNFSQANMLGQGGFGPVYKGKLSTKQEVAVKRLSKTSGQDVEEFKNEVILIAKLQHINLVRLLGCCIQGEERMLIYDYMQNNSLSHFLYDPDKSALLTWPKRFEIIMGIARGLLYLHQDSRLKIIHRDLKTSNILLDSNLVPKISDFGLARIFGGDQPFAKTKRVIGTYGYMAPEYAIDGKFSVKSDVFSMGVLILEIVSGKKNRNFSHPDHHHNLLGHAWLLWNENRAMELIDSCIKDDSSLDKCEVKRCIQVGLLCVQQLAEDRPLMSSALFKLGNEEATLPHPKQPGFFIERSSINSPEEDESNNHEILTITITELEGR